MWAAATLAIPQLRTLVDDLVKGREHVVGKLDLGNGPHALRRKADAEAHDALLRQRRVEHPVCAVRLGQLHRASEHASKGDVLAKDQDVVVLGQRGAQRVVDGLEEVHLPRGAIADLGGDLVDISERGLTALGQYRRRGVVDGEVELRIRRVRRVAAGETEGQMR